MNLSTMQCQSCRHGAQAITDQDLDTWLDQLNDWQLVTDKGVKKLQQAFKFKNYSQSMAFANAVAQQAETEDHHPLMIIEYACVTVVWWTHSINGLHQNDFILAARTSALAAT
jgi:4a-hydroxytetrahydrobiopterin dehydratase